jgi:hypothetical protein
MGRNANSTKIKAIRVPAGLNRHVGMSELVSMPCACPIEKAKFVILQIENLTPQFRRQFRSPWPVLGIRYFVDPTRVVQDCEERHNFDVGCCLRGQSLAILQNSGPMRHTVCPVPRERVVLQDGFEDEGQVELHTTTLLNNSER